MCVEFYFLFLALYTTTLTRLIILSHFPRTKIKNGSLQKKCFTTRGSLYKIQYQNSNINKSQYNYKMKLPHAPPGRPKTTNSIRGERPKQSPRKKKPSLDRCESSFLHDGCNVHIDSVILRRATKNGGRSGKILMG